MSRFVAIALHLKGLVVLPNSPLAADVASWCIQQRLSAGSLEGQPQAMLRGQSRPIAAALKSIEESCLCSDCYGARMQHMFEPLS